MTTAQSILQLLPAWHIRLLFFFSLREKLSIKNKRNKMVLKLVQPRWFICGIVSFQPF